VHVGSLCFARTAYRGDGKGRKARNAPFRQTFGCGAVCLFWSRRGSGSYQPRRTDRLEPRLGQLPPPPGGKFCIDAAIGIDVAPRHRSLRHIEDEVETRAKSVVARQKSQALQIPDVFLIVLVGGLF
jgi:hypothetical protein